jgi:hypothetical protein
VGNWAGGQVGRTGRAHRLTRLLADLSSVLHCYAQKFSEPAQILFLFLKWRRGLPFRRRNHQSPIILELLIVDWRFSI